MWKAPLPAIWQRLLWQQSCKIDPCRNSPKETAIGALGLYVSDESITHFQPMNVNFSIIAPLAYRVKKKAEKNLAIANRSLEIIEKLKESL